MTASHPTDRTLAALIDGRLDDEAAVAARRHVDDCPRCQLRIGAAGDRLAAPSLPGSGPVQVPLLAASAAALPQRGDVWRLAWDDTTVLVVVWRVDGDRVAVEPLVDTSDADDWCALLPHELTGGLGEIAVSVALETTVPWAVLDTRIGHLDELEPLVSLRGAFRAGGPTTTLRGSRVDSALDERLPGLEEIAEDLAELANATWAPVEAERTAVALDFDQLVDAGIPVNRALAIMRGGAVTDPEADLIEEATGERPSAAPVPDELRRTIDQPRRKAAIRARAAASGEHEAAFRLLLARSAEPQLAAARGTQSAPPDYDTILDRLLDD